MLKPHLCLKMTQTVVLMSSPSCVLARVFMLICSVCPSPASVLQPQHGRDVWQHPEQAAAAEAQHLQRCPTPAGGSAAEGPYQEARLHQRLCKCVCVCVGLDVFQYQLLYLCSTINSANCPPPPPVSPQTEIKNHMFFSPINWDDLNAKKLTPPFNPNVVRSFHGPFEWRLCQTLVFSTQGVIHPLT